MKSRADILAQIDAIKARMAPNRWGQHHELLYLLRQLALEDDRTPDLVYAINRQEKRK